MKKITLVSIYSFVFLILCSLITYFLKYIPLSNDMLLIGIAIILMSLSFILKFLAPKFKITKYICYLINSIAMGFTLRAWYLYRNIDNDIITMILISVFAIVYLWLFYILLEIPIIKENMEMFLLMFLGGILILYVTLVAYTKTTYISTIGFYLLIETAFGFALCRNTITIDDTTKDIMLCTFSVIVVIIIVIIALYSGEGLDNVDVDFSGLTKKKDEEE